MPIFGKVFAILLLIAAIGYGIVYALAPWMASQRMRKFEPRLSLVPVDLPSNAEVPLSNWTIDRYGYKVPLPNEAIVPTHHGDDLMTLVSISNGGFLTIHNPSRDSGILEIEITDKHAQRLVGKQLFQSKFKLMQAAMWTTPEQVKWWKFRSSENEKTQLLLLTKFVVVFTSHGSPALGPIYPISAGVFRGFQIGDPNIPPYEAHLDLFDRTDRHFAFDVSGPEGHGQVLTQGEINAMVASIQPISAR